MEYRDLYDQNRVLTGEKILKDEEIPTGKYGLMVVWFIENTDGKFLMQKRSINKGSKWATTGGHPKSGESSLDGIITEVKEELGIDISKDDLVLFKKAQGKNSFCDLYYLNKNINLTDITIQEEEVENVNWLSIDEINNLNSNNEFIKGHYMMFQDCLDFLKK